MLNKLALHFHFGIEGEDVNQDSQEKTFAQEVRPNVEGLIVPHEHRSQASPESLKANSVACVQVGIEPHVLFKFPNCAYELFSSLHNLFTLFFVIGFLLVGKVDRI